MSFSSRGGPAHFSYPSSQGGGGGGKKEGRKEETKRTTETETSRHERKTKDGRNSKIKGRDIQYSTEGRWDEKVKN